MGDGSTLANRWHLLKSVVGWASGGFLADHQNHREPPPKKASTVMGSGIAGSEMESPVDPKGYITF